MEDFNALASSLAAGVVDVRGCLIVSRDGLVLGAYPLDGEDQTKYAWLRFATMGDPERGFAQFGPETWCYVRRGPYAAFAVVGPAARPGLVIDHIEQVLLAAEKARGKLEAVRTEPAASPSAPTGKPRTPLHAERPAEEPVRIGVEMPEAIVRGGDPSPVLLDASTPGVFQPLGEHPSLEVVSPASTEPAPTPAADPEPTAVPGPAGVWATSDDGDEVDRFSLTREFGQLLQDDQPRADG